MKGYSLIFCCVFVNILIFKTAVLADGPGSIREYCHIDTFNPQCSNNEVIVITHALFGRMRTGRCVKIADNIGCSKDVKNFLHKTCSGRNTCSIQNHELSIEAQLNCLREMHAYLEASYKCQSVFTPSAPHCSSPTVIEATSRSQFISSIISKESSCGLHQTPYILEAKSGQTVEITLHDFNSLSVDDSNTCLKYGYLMDTKTDKVVNLCGGTQRTQVVFTTADKSVQVLLERAAVSNYHFLLEFKAIGCPDIKAPKHSWINRENSSVTIGCQTSDAKWTMKCVGNIWLGIMKDCPAPKPTIIPTNEVRNTQPPKHSDSMPDVNDNHLFAIGIGCLTVIICVTTMMLGIHCCKRYELSMQKKDSYYLNTFTPQGTIYRPVNNGTLPPAFNAGLPLYTLDRNTQNSDANAPELPRRTSSMIERTQANNSNAPDYFNLVNVDGGNNQEKIYQSIPREGPLI